MNENSVITKTRRRKLCMAASDPEKPLAVITHVAFGNGGVNGSGEPLVPLETQTALNSELARYEESLGRTGGRGDQRGSAGGQRWGCGGHQDHVPQEEG